ncbi:MAG: DUF4124 domain-containing protein, partial [Nitrospinaceae bacterium]|nr:DUF4124 domain-containing protein [Nitrospinaceae bacterium]NIT81638.1 DUF4124 domain-containing protein [Nitrospinaceae bacterium]NIW05512.1 DUF4124 domain-containing protein [Nitrospinaceae bacterium]NIX34044.1 DUF4124 domain-containing protein [Nitrospinaceae bacterium]NIY14789.1 DUF4124 domain-containing protein [Nitrospinaceae bacterium]
MLNRFHWSLSSKVFWGIAVFLLAVGVTPSHSKIFKWKDDKGKVHFTDDISKIPFKYRNRDKTKTLKGGPVDVPKPSFLLPEEEHKAHVIQVKAIPGGHYMVEVLINGEIPANLMVDTGATMVMLSEDLGQKLGVNQDPSLPQMKFNTAGGMMESPL